MKYTRADLLKMGVSPDQIPGPATKTPPKPKPVGKTYAPGETVCRFVIHSRPRPWAVSIVRRGKGPPTNPKLVLWQQAVRAAAIEAMAGRLPHSGTYELRCVFMLTPKPSMPDGVNLAKSTEDALQGVVILNDKTGRNYRLASNYDADQDMAAVEVIAL